MKVFVAIGSWDYDSDVHQDKPIGVYSTENLARRAIKLNEQKYTEMLVLSYEIDDPATLQPKPQE